MTEKRHRSSHEGDQQQNRSCALAEVEAPQKFTYLRPPPPPLDPTKRITVLRCIVLAGIYVSPDFVGVSPSRASEGKILWPRSRFIENVLSFEYFSDVLSYPTIPDRPNHPGSVFDDDSTVTISRRRYASHN